MINLHDMYSTVWQDIQPIAMHAGLPNHTRLGVRIQHSLTVVFETANQQWKTFEVINNLGFTNQLLSYLQMHTQCIRGEILISSAHRREIALNRRNVYRLFETVVFLGKPGIPFFTQ